MVNDSIKMRLDDECSYILTHYDEPAMLTIRKIAAAVYSNRSTVHKDITERLYKNSLPARIMQRAREVNLQERAYRGGKATRRAKEDV